MITAILLDASFETLNTGLTNLAGQIKFIGVGLIALALAVMGICLVIPSRRANEFARQHFWHILLGALLMGGAVVIGGVIMSNVNF